MPAQVASSARHRSAERVAYSALRSPQESPAEAAATAGAAVTKQLAWLGGSAESQLELSHSATQPAAPAGVEGTSSAGQRAAPAWSLPAGGDVDDDELAEPTAADATLSMPPPALAEPSGPAPEAAASDVTGHTQVHIRVAAASVPPVPRMPAFAK